MVFAYMNETPLLQQNDKISLPDKKGQLKSFLKYAQSVRKAWAIREEATAVNNSLKQIIDDLTKAWNLEKPDFKTKVGKESHTDFDVIPPLISVQSREKRFEGGQDVYVHEATHLLLQQNNEKYAALVKQKFDYLKDFFQTFTQQLETNSFQKEILERLPELASFYCTAETYEEMIASLAGHHLHKSNSQEETDLKKQLVVKNMKEIREWMNTYKKEYDAILRFPLGDIGKFMLKMKVSSQIRFLEKKLYEVGQMLGSILASEHPDLSVKNLIHKDPNSMTDLLELENEDQLTVFLQKITRP